MTMKKRFVTKIALRIIVFALLSAIVLNMYACGNKKSKDEIPPETVTVTDDDSDITEPTLLIRKTKAKAGDKNVEVVVEVKNNPGILGIDFDLYYDDSAVTLVKAKSELNLEGCSYTPPSYYRNPTTFLWDFQTANWTEDGVFLKLYFDISETASVGEHEIKIMHSYRNIFDEDGTPINVQVKNAYIFVEE